MHTVLHTFCKGCGTCRRRRRGAQRASSAREVGGEGAADARHRRRSHPTRWRRVTKRIPSGDQVI